MTAIFSDNLQPDNDGIHGVIAAWAIVVVTFSLFVAASALGKL